MFHKMILQRIGVFCFSLSLVVLTLGHSHGIHKRDLSSESDSESFDEISDDGDVEPISYVRRSLSPMPIYQTRLEGRMTHKSMHPASTESRTVEIASEVSIDSVLPHLHSAVTLRDNIIFVFSYMLHGQKDILSEQQYSALQLIYDLLRKKRVCIFNMLPIVSRLASMDKNKQMETILLAMKENLPDYVQCAATYLAREIARGNIDLNTILRPTALEVFDFLNGLQTEMVDTCVLDICKEERDVHGSDAKVTMASMGSVFVQIQRQIEIGKWPLTQELFGLILINLPNPDGDPVLDEYVRYIYDVTRHNYLKFWISSISPSEISNERNLVAPMKGIYKYVIQAIKINLPHEQMPWVVKHAMTYILTHLKMVPTTASNPNFEQIHAVTKNGINLYSLLTSIVTPEFSPDAKHLSDVLLIFFDKNVANNDLDEVFDFNRFTYPDPMDLMLALLTRVKTRTAPSNIQLLRPARALLSALIFKKDARVFTTDLSSAVDLPSLLEILKAQHLGPDVTGIADLVLEHLFEVPELIFDINKKIPHSKEFCRAPRQCLLTAIKNIKQSQLAPKALLNSIKELISYVTSEIDSMMYNNEKFSNKPPVFNKHDTDEDNPLIKTVPAIEETMETVGTVRPITVPARQKKKKKKISLGSRSEDVGSESSEEEDVKFPSNTGHPGKAPMATNQMIHMFPVSKPSVKLVTEAISVEEQDNVFTTEAPKQIVISKVPSIGKSKKPGKKIHRIKITTNTPTESVEEVDYEPEVNVPSHNRTTVILPPNVEPNKTIHIDISENGVTVITTNSEVTSKSDISVPPVSVLLARPNANKPLENLGSNIEKQILQPLELIFGKKYVEKILGSRARIEKYPTNVALLIDVLEEARQNPQVKKNKLLLANIRKFIVHLEYIAVTVLLPVVVTSEDITSEVVYSSFNPSNPSSSVLSKVPPHHQSSSMITVALTNPKQLLESVNSTDPYSGLLPDLPRGDPLEVKLRPLKIILTKKRIVTLLGKEFNPHVYPTKGALLVTLLEKLLHVEEIYTNSELRILIQEYLKALALPSMYISVPVNFIMNTVSAPTGKWQPELTSLLKSLPPPFNTHQLNMMEIIYDFLQTPNLLEQLGLPMPSMLTTRGELLKAIFKSALRSTNVTLTESQTSAIKYYKNKIVMIGPGALPILWAWVRVYVLKTEVKLGKLIESTIDFDQLPYNKKLAYNKVVIYFSEHPQLLQNSHFFEFEKYRTQGEFLRGFFRHLLKQQNIDKSAKKSIKMLLPHIQLTGLGALQIPTWIQNRFLNK